MKPLGDRVLIKPDPQGDAKKGSLWIPDVARSKPQEGVVIAVGSKVRDLIGGERVLFGRYVGSELLIHDEVYLIVREPDIMGVLS